MKILILSLLLACISSAQIQPLIKTYLGDEQRNFYGNTSPSKLRQIWKTDLGTAFTMVSGEKKSWSGAGWTGQPLVISEDGELFLIQPTLSHHLKKILASSGEIIWSCDLGDAIKGTQASSSPTTKTPSRNSSLSPDLVTVKTQIS